MFFMPLIMLLLLVTIVGVGASLFGMYLGKRQVPDGDRAGTNRLLAEQAQRIEQLESELRHLQEQADFTERLLGERGGSRDPGDSSRDA